MEIADKTNLTWDVSGIRVQGASHVALGTPCQDAYEFWTNDDGTKVILAIADGHGGDPHPMSEQGSRIAVEVALAVFRHILSDTNSTLSSLRARQESISRQILYAWTQQILAFHHQHHQPTCLPIETEPEIHAILKLYGTTLLVVVLTEEFVLFWKIGDGDIVALDEQMLPMAIFTEVDDELWNSQSYSLCMRQASTKARMICRQTKEQWPALIVVSTDGLKDSFPSADDFLMAIRRIGNEVVLHGLELVHESLKNRLHHTSQYGSGDDITVGIIIKRQHKALPNQLEHHLPLPTKES